MSCSGGCGKKETQAAPKISLPKPKTVKVAYRPLPAKNVTIIRGR